MKLFSRPGDPPTTHELMLFAEQPAPSTSSIVLIGQRIGLPALMVVMDELGGGVSYIPTRKHFMAALWQPARDEQIRALHRAGIHVEEIARTFELSRPGVLRVLSACSSKARA